MTAITVGPWRDVAQQLVQIADSLNASGSALVEAKSLGGRVHQPLSSDYDPFLKFGSEAERTQWREHVAAGGSELGVAYAGARIVERNLRALSLPTAERAIPAAIIGELARNVGYAETMNGQRGALVSHIDRIAAEADTTHGLRGRPSIDFTTSSSYLYDGVTTGREQVVQAVRELAHAAEALDRPVDTSTLVRLHGERGTQLAMGDPTTLLRDATTRAGSELETALETRLRATPMVETIVRAAPPATTPLTRATRDDLLATALHRLDAASVDGKLSAGDALDAYRDLAALATHSPEFTDALAPVLAAAERSTIDEVARRAPVTRSSTFDEGRDMWGIEPVPTIAGLGADSTAHAARVRSAIVQLQAGVPELQQTIRAAAPAPTALDAETEFLTRLNASRTSLALEA
ncbi:MAG: hypothetical protein JWL76_1160 [Thermoleophilia bacterium]|nr:hypothetical protein [Thermoleophilia bacterium]